MLKLQMYAQTQGKYLSGQKIKQTHRVQSLGTKVDRGKQVLMR